MSLRQLFWLPISTVSHSVEKNLKKMEQIIEVAHKKKVNILIFPELSVTGYIWKSSDPAPVWDLLAEGENSRMESWLKNVRDSLTDGEGGLEYIFYNNVREKNKDYYNCSFILNPGNEELLIIRNLDIKGQRDREKDDFNYRIDFHEFYRQMKYPADCIHFFDEE